MRFTRVGQEQRLELNITPLIDVVFLLLIFFMVSTTFDRDAKLRIELPEASAKTQEVEDRSITVAIDATGRYYVDGRPLINTQADTIKQAIARAREGKQVSPSLVISADAATPHQAVVTVMDAARQLGLAQLSFATRLTHEERASGVSP